MATAKDAKLAKERREKLVPEEGWSHPPCYPHLSRYEAVQTWNYALYV